jgi:hypothetical protein
VPNSWDENAISNFSQSSKTTFHAVDLTEGGKLLFGTQDPSVLPNIAQETNAIFRWLGAPRGFTLILFWRNDPRIIGPTEWPGRRNVNGGFAVPDSNQITVYRQEEWDRVLLHEAIHALGWDWEVPSTVLPCWGLDPRSTVAPHLFESWTELYAEWLWCGWYNVSWSKQCAWQEMQAVQVLARAPTIWKEDTNIFAYYVLKTALAPHIAFLWTVSQSMSPEERIYILCELAGPRLAELRAKATRTVPTAIRMRMSVP